MTYRNNEGFPDPTAGRAINGVRWEELQKIREERYGHKRGEIVTLRMNEPDEDPRRTKSVKKRVRIVEYYRYVVLVEFQNGERHCFSYWQMERMLAGQQDV